MRFLFLLVGVLSYSLAIGQNRITIKKSAHGKLTAVCSVNNQEVPCSAIDTKQEIPIVIEEALPKNPQILVTDTKGQPTPSHANNAKIIGASDDTAIAYNIKIAFSSTDTLSITGIGSEKTAQPNAALVKRSVADNNCACHGQTKDKANRSTDIVKALDLCPDCGDEDFLVYDAHCKSLYKRKDDNSFSRITDLRDVSFKYKDEIKVKVIHVNRYLKDVLITADDLIYKSEAPGLFDDFFGSSGQLLTGLRGAIKTQGEGAKTAYNKLEEALRKFNSLMAELKERRDRAYSLCCEATKNCGEINLGTSFSDLSSRLFELNVSYNLFAKELKKEAGERDALKASIKKVDEDIAKAKDPEKPELLKKKGELELKLKGFADDLDDQIKQLDALWTVFEKPTEEQIRNLILFANNYLKENYTFSTPPIYPLGNRLNIKINIDSKDDLKEIKERIIPTDHQALEIEGPVLNKWLFSFSSGPFIGYNDALYETNYQFQKIPSSGNQIDENSRYTLTPSGKTNPPVGLSALAHFENKFAEYFGWGLSVGVGLTIETKPRPVYFFGPSFFIGDKNRFALTAGIAAMQVDVLKKDLYPDGLVYKNTEVLQYYKDLRMGGFVSLTYTLFTIESKNKQPKISTTTTTTPTK